MGKSFHVVRPLEPPLLEVEDRVMFIPRGSELIVDKVEARVLLICDGRARLTVDQQPIGEVGPGDILIITGPCRQVYRPLQDRTETRLLVFRIVLDSSQLTFDPATGWPAQLGAKHEETDFTVFVQNHFSRLRHLVRGTTPAMHELLEAIRRDADAETPGFRHRVSARGRLLLTMIGERLAGAAIREATRVVQARHVWISEQVKEYLLTHACEAVTLDQVARHLRLSAEHLARVFRTQTSITIFDFLREARINRAKTLLASAHLSIEEIARETGYSSTTLFCRNFKRTTGMTPTMYREKGGGRHSFSGSALRSAMR